MIKSAASSLTSALPVEEELEDALRALFESVDRHDAPGMVVGVAQRGLLLLRRGYGLASVALGVPNTPATRMRIGSTSKHFTCLAALLLAEEGRLEIDASVGHYLPEWPEKVQQPTLRQLMTHTAGVRCYLDLFPLASGMAMQPEGAVIQALLRQSALNFAPGSEFLYSNGGYQLLSEVIARAAGMPFEQVLQTRIFTPLGMGHTASMPDDGALLPGLADLHVPQPDGSYRRGFFPIRDFRGEGAMVSTVDDLLKWLAHLRSPSLVGSAQSWRDMLQTARLDNGESLPYALGLMRHAYRGVEVIHHAGGVVGGSCQMLTVPAHELDIVLLLNGAPLNPMELAWRIVDHLLGTQHLGAVVPRADVARFRPLVGVRYRDPASGYVIEFVDLEGRLALKSWNLMPVAMHDHGAVLRVGAEDMPESGIEIAVADLLAGKGAPTVLPAVRGGRPLQLQRLPADSPTNASVGAALVGNYIATDLAAEVSITLKGESMEMTLQARAPAVRCVLQAWSPEVFGLSAPELPEVPLSGVISVQREAVPSGTLGNQGNEGPVGAVTGLYLDTFRSRRLWLERVPPPSAAAGGGP
jgi:CubicO group peptidase (beta-lactamase class C family)